MAERSSDGGRAWTAEGTVPLYKGSVEPNYHEPHVVELPSGKLLGVIRVQSFGSDDVTRLGMADFSMAQAESTDGGRSGQAPAKGVPWLAATPAAALVGRAHPDLWLPSRALRPACRPELGHGATGITIGSSATMAPIATSATPPLWIPPTAACSPCTTRRWRQPEVLVALVALATAMK